MKGYLTDRVKINQIVTTAAGAAGTSAITSSAVNMAGCDGVLFIVTLGAIVSGAVTSLKIQQSSDDGGSDNYSDVEGTNQTIADTADNTTLYVDMARPGKQYLKLVISRATQDATVGGVTAIQYARRTVGANTQGSNVSGERWISPPEGTA